MASGSGDVDRTGSRVDFESDFFSVRTDSYVYRTATRERSHTYVDRRPGVVAVPVEAGRVALVEQFRYPVGERTLEFPIGGLEAGESPLQGAQRELAEEVGVTAKDWTRLGHLWEVPGWSNSACHVFLARDLEYGTRSPDRSEEDLLVRWIDIVQVRTEIASGRIRDSLTMAAYQLVVGCQYDGDGVRQIGAG